MQSQCTQQFYQEPISLQKAADYTGFTTDELILKAAIGKLPVCFHYYGFVGLFQATAKDGPIVRFSPHTPNDDDDALPPHPGDFSVVSGIFRSFKEPVILCRNPADVWFCPAAIEAITISSESEQLPVVPDGFALGRVDAVSRCLDDSPVRIDDWLFLREDLARVAAESRLPPATLPPAPVAPEVTDAAAGQGEAAAEQKAIDDVERRRENERNMLALEANTLPPVLPEQSAITSYGAKEKAPSRAQTKLLQIIDALENYADGVSRPFDRQAMPGPLGDSFDDKGSFHWLCAQIDRIFNKAPTTFEKHRAGICAVARWAQPTEFYSSALPHIARILNDAKKGKKRS